MSVHTTWRQGSGLFTFDLSVPVFGSPSATMARAATAVLRYLPEIGAAASVALSTLSHGDDALMWRDAEVDAASIARAVEAHIDAARVIVTGDLRCVDLDGSDIPIARALSIWIELPDLGAPDPTATAELEITISIDVDIFAARSWGDERDNARLAAVNAPRFNRFLAALCRDTNATVTGVDAEDYPGESDVFGFTAGDASTPE
jgi:hypothetical protein